MMSNDEPKFDEIVSSWIDEHKDYQSQHDISVGWAYRKLNSICESDPSSALQLIEAICKKDKSDQIMAVLAAGPLENLLVMHGKKIIDGVVSIAARDSDFRHLLGGVWTSGLDSEVRSRLEAIQTTTW